MNKKILGNLSTFFVHKKRGTALFVFETIFPLLSMYLIVISLNYIEVSIVNSFNGARPIFTILFSIFIAYILQRNTQEKVDSVNIFIKFISGILALIRNNTVGLIWKIYFIILSIFGLINTEIFLQLNT